jgi:hypothetical protein
MCVWTILRPDNSSLGQFFTRTVLRPDNFSLRQFFAGQFFARIILRWKFLHTDNSSPLQFFGRKFFPRTVLRPEIFSPDNSSPGQFFDWTILFFVSKFHNFFKKTEPCFKKFTIDNIFYFVVVQNSKPTTHIYKTVAVQYTVESAQLRFALKNFGRISSDLGEFRLFVHSF